jgi:hypothetical protein
VATDFRVADEDPIAGDVQEKRRKLVAGVADARTHVYVGIVE